MGNNHDPEKRIFFSPEERQEILDKAKEINESRDTLEDDSGYAREMNRAEVLRRAQEVMEERGLEEDTEEIIDRKPLDDSEKRVSLSIAEVLARAERIKKERGEE